MHERGRPANVETRSARAADEDRHTETNFARLNRSTIPIPRGGPLARPLLVIPKPLRLRREARDEQYRDHWAYRLCRYPRRGVRWREGQRGLDRAGNAKSVRRSPRLLAGVAVRQFWSFCAVQLDVCGHLDLVRAGCG